MLVTEEELHACIAEMGETLYEQFQNKNPLFLSVLKGSFVFMADLVRACQVKSDVEFIAVSLLPECHHLPVGCRSPTISSRTSPAASDHRGGHPDSGNTLAFLKRVFHDQGSRLHHHCDAAG